jgi:hypothetical protein
MALGPNVMNALVSRTTKKNNLKKNSSSPGMVGAREEQ